MLQSISWSEFITAVAVLVALYYLVSVLVYYRKDIANVLKNRNKSESTDPDETTDDSVMGGTRSAQDVSREERIAPEEIQIISKQQDSNQADADSLLVGTVSDLLQEVRLLHEKIQSHSKDELIPVFRELLAKYPQLIDTQYQEAINLFIVNASQESGNWEFDSVEVEALWPKQV